MAILDVQRNHMTIFNIRFGEKVTTKNGKEAPAMLSGKMRITSPNKDVVDAFVAQYGGATEPWDAGQWEAYLPIGSIPIMVLPGQSVIQWWEQYRGGVCERRCEGTGGKETISGKGCMCDPDIDVRQGDRNQCSLMTRLNFLCPDVAVVGAGSLVTHGKIAAETLPQAVAVAEAALRQGRMVPAVLRSVTRVGKNRQYVVPQIEIVGMSYNALVSGDVDSAALQSGEKATPALDNGGTRELAPPKENRVVDHEAPVPPQASSSASPPASSAMIASVTKQAIAKGLHEDDLADLALETTGKYVEEVGFSVDDANAVLDAIRAWRE